MTLAGAREYVRPGPERSATRKEWISFYQHCATVFRKVAGTDPRHTHEAMAEAAIAKDWAAKLTEDREKVGPEAYYIP
ncbi:AMED_5909 family protein [Actinokineospora iranica]|uniref:Uncharacterized protein n=1 Tax=Actinokineospora iranica TaxID=1271860 RepID=A0A1G6PJY3_9PSEU|nr:AMED_5909 family protein [Actinokineospora iranica]SDC79884.1 hypothetical protein SAMN05216174_104311 [Actinokineospora iranica]